MQPICCRPLSTVDASLSGAATVGILNKKQHVPRSAHRIPYASVFGHRTVVRRRGEVRTTPAKLGQPIVPALLVRDMEQTPLFYQVLGFQITGKSPDGPSPVWAEVSRDSVVIQFHTKPPCGTPPTPVCSGTFYMYPDGVTNLAEEFRDMVDFVWGPEVMDYGMPEFGIHDPNGYFLALTERALLGAAANAQPASWLFCD